MHALKHERHTILGLNEISQIKLARTWLQEQRPRLFLNAVGGEATIPLLKCMAEPGQVITYGALAKQPLMVPFSAHVFNDIRYQGF